MYLINTNAIISGGWESKVFFVIVGPCATMEKGVYCIPLAGIGLKMFRKRCIQMVCYVKATSLRVTKKAREQGVVLVLCSSIHTSQKHNVVWIASYVLSRFCDAEFQRGASIKAYSQCPYTCKIFNPWVSGRYQLWKILRCWSVGRLDVRFLHLAWSL